MSRNLMRRCCFFLILLVLLPTAVGAAEFSAQMLIKDGDKLMPGRIFIQGEKMRQEFNDEQGQTVTIVRPDQKVVWVIIPRERAYSELPLKDRLPGQFIQIPPGAVKKRPLGKETINGYETEKFQIAVQGADGLEFQTFWVAPKLGVPLKMVCDRRKFCIEYRNIKEGKQGDRLFVLPTGYQKTAPRGFADKLLD